MKNLDTGQIENITLRTSLYNMTVSINYEKTERRTKDIISKIEINNNYNVII